MARCPGGAVLCFGGNALFSDTCTCEASGVQRPAQKMQEKGTGAHVLGRFWALARLRTLGSASFLWSRESTAPGRRSPPRRPPPSKPPPEPRSDAAPQGRIQGPRRVRGLASQGRRREGAPPLLSGWLLFEVSRARRT